MNSWIILSILAALLPISLGQLLNLDLGLKLGNAVPEISNEDKVPEEEDPEDRQRNDMRYVWIDYDAGIDDAEALILAIKATRVRELNFRIVGISCVGGNTNITNCYRNTHRVFRLMDERRIRVFRGTNEEFVIPYIAEGPPFHGEDGLGDADWPEERTNSQNGIQAMIAASYAYSGRLTIFAVGPLTNLAIASKLDPGIRTRVKELIIMGGNLFGFGNIKVTREFNFYADPEAASVVLNTFKCPITITPLETCHWNLVSCDYRINYLEKLDTKEAKFIQKIEKKNIERIFCPHNEGWITYDPMAMATFIEPRLITRMTEQYSTVELSGNYTRGMMVVDWDRALDQPKNTKLILSIDMELYLKMLVWMFDESKYYK